jgi:pimeloyl-ACP methyl ester carboxylesterase
MWRVPIYVAAPVLAATVYLALSYTANRFVYFPAKYPEGPWNAQAVLRATDVWLETADGVRIHAWWVPRDGASIVTLHLHGNGGNITHRYTRLGEIAAAGSAALALDYRGYGKSEGRPTEQGLYRDADAAYDYLLKAGFRPDQIAIHGESLGTAVAVDLAARRPCAAVVLEAPFTSAKDVAQTVAPVIGPMLIWGFDSRAKIGRIHAPIFFIHGDRDRVVPLRLGQGLFAAAHEPKSLWLVWGAGHNDIAETAGPAYRQRLRAFYESLPKPTR